MEIAPVILIVLVVLTLVAVGGYFAWKQEMKRREALKAFSLERGWSFDHHKDRSFPGRWRDFSCFQRGHSRYAYNRMRGPFAIAGESGETLRLTAEAGDYHYCVTSGSGKNRSTRTYRFSYLLVESPVAGGDLAVRREHWGDKLAAGLGFDDIDFESAEFSDRFHVKAADKRFAYDVIHPRMMEFLLDSLTPDFEIRGGVLCVTGGRDRWDPAEFELRLRWIERFYMLWPSHLQTS